MLPFDQNKNSSSPRNLSTRFPKLHSILWRVALLLSPRNHGYRLAQLDCVLWGIQPHITLFLSPCHHCSCISQLDTVLWAIPLLLAPSDDCARSAELDDVVGLVTFSPCDDCGGVAVRDCIRAIALVLTPGDYCCGLADSKSV